MSIGDLASRTCVPCRGGIPPLTREQAAELLAKAPGWRLAENGTRLERRFEFEDFRNAIAFVNRVADVAEEQGHHPDIAIHWNKVDLTLWTHKIGGLHENDFILAAKINRLLEESSVPSPGRFFVASLLRMRGAPNVGG